MTKVMTSGDGLQLLQKQQQQSLTTNEDCDCKEAVLCPSTQPHVMRHHKYLVNPCHVASEKGSHLLVKWDKDGKPERQVTRAHSPVECDNDGKTLHADGGLSTGWQVPASLHGNVHPSNSMPTSVVAGGEASVTAVPGVALEQQPFVIHSVGVCDFLIGDMFICPQTLELVCLQKMFDLALEFSWELSPSPAILSERIVKPKGFFDTLLAPIRPATGVALPAALNPSSGELHCGKSLLKILRSRVIPHQATKKEASKGTDKHGEDSGVLQYCSQHKDPRVLNKSCCYTCIDKVTRFAVTEMVERSLQAALNYYIWVDDATFWNFTLPLHHHTFGYIYGTYYSMRRRASFLRLTPRSPAPNSLDLNFIKSEHGTDGIIDSCRNILPLHEETIIRELCKVLRTLDTLLADRNFLGGDDVDVVDACVFSHLAIVFSLPLPDRPKLQKAILPHRGLMEYCKRIHLKFSPWPHGPSFLFGCRSLISAATDGAALTVHSWRQRSVKQDPLESEGNAASEKLLWSIAAIACTAVVVFSAARPWRNSVTGVVTEEHLDGAEGFDEELLEAGQSK